jgi:hypothetical protein
MPDFYGERLSDATCMKSMMACGAKPCSCNNIGGVFQNSNRIENEPSYLESATYNDMLDRCANFEKYWTWSASKYLLGVFQ